MAEPDDDDAALRWAGDEERGRDAPRLRGDEPEVVATVFDAEEAAAPGSRGRAAATAAFALPYLLYAVAWIYVVQGASGTGGPLWSEIIRQFGVFLTLLATPVWFATVISLTRDSRPLVRVGWLGVGLGVLFPWAFLVNLLLALQIAGYSS